MFEGFTDAARQAVVFAQEEAQTAGHTQIGTEHVLLGLIDQEGVVVEVLTGLGVAPDQVRQRVGESVGPARSRRQTLDDAGARSGLRALLPGRRRSRAGHIPFNSHTKRSFELALSSAVDLGDDHLIGAEHLFLGLIRESDGAGGQVMAECGVDYERARAEVVRLSG